MTDPRIELAAKLREYRIQADMLITEAAEKMKVPPHVLASWEEGKGLPEDVDQVLKLGWLYTGQNEKSPELWDLLVDAQKAARADAVAGRFEVMGQGARGDEPASNEPLVFLCHSSGDKDLVRPLYGKLVDENVRCWFDEVHLLPGQNWQYEITRAIKRSKFVLACLSQKSVTKTGYVQKELKKALDVADEQPEGVAFLIPVRLEECEIPDRLSEWQWVDLFEDSGYDRLLRVLKSPP
jgi:hypothetical protein